MKVILTGVAGFIGSNLTRRLLQENIEVIGVDNFYHNYDRRQKEYNIKDIRKEPKFTFYELSIESELDELPLDDVDVVLHLSALPGVRKSWGSRFYEYTNNNIIATQKILERLVDKPETKLIYASSSSIYGETRPIPFQEESSIPKPKSPYGVTKLAGEHLIDLYALNYDITSTILRLFTVYGPAQRPDMAFHRFFKLIEAEEPIQIYGSLDYARDYTFIDDCISAFISVIERNVWNETINIGSSKVYSLGDIIDLMGDITGCDVKYEVIEDMPGDVEKTFADISKAESLLKYQPQWHLSDGLVEEYKWIENYYQY